jgi:hypothetical protein
MNLSNFASAVAEEHELFLQALNGRYLQMLTPGAAPSPRAIIELTKVLGSMGGALTARMSDEADDLVSALGKDADQGAREAMGGLLTAFKADFAVIAAQNVNTAIRTAKTGRDDFGKIFTQSLGGAMGELMLKKMQKIDFKVPDKTARNWDATRYVSFLAREFIYRIKLLRQLSDVKDDLGEVFYPDHESDGMVFVIRGDHPGIQTYKDIEKTVFHPNSKAEVTFHAHA